MSIETNIAQFLELLGRSADVEIDIEGLKGAIVKFDDFNEAFNNWLRKYNRKISYTYRNYASVGKEWIAINFENDFRRFELARPIDNFHHTPNPQRIAEQVLLAHAVRESTPEFTRIYLNTEVQRKDNWITQVAHENNAPVESSTKFNDEAKAAPIALREEPIAPAAVIPPAVAQEMTNPTFSPGPQFGPAVKLFLSDEAFMGRLAKSMNNPLDTFVTKLTNDLDKYCSNDSERVQALTALTELLEPKVKDYVRIIRKGNK